VKKLQRIFGAILAALARGFSDRHFERGEGPGDDVEQRNEAQQKKFLFTQLPRGKWYKTIGS